MITNNKGFILLTSIGLSCEKAFEYLKTFSENLPKVVSIIVTASEDKKDNKYVKLAVSQFNKIGIQDVRLIDLELGEIVPSNTDIIYVSGGNTFHLMYYVKQSNFIKSIQDILAKKGLYIGVSAGSIIVGNSIESAFVAGDNNLMMLDDLTGLNLVDFSVFPHSDEEIELEIANHKKFKNPLFIKNDEAFLVELSDENILNSQFL